MALFLIGEKILCSTKGVVYLDKDNLIAKFPFTVNFGDEVHEVYKLEREPLPFQTNNRMAVASYPYFIEKMQQLGSADLISDMKPISPKDTEIILKEIEEKR